QLIAGDDGPASRLTRAQRDQGAVQAQVEDVDHAELAIGERDVREQRVVQPCFTVRGEVHDVTPRRLGRDVGSRRVAFEVGRSTQQLGDRPRLVHDTTQLPTAAVPDHE